MANKIGKAKDAALQFFKTANPEDEFFLVSFNDRTQVLSPFTSNIEDLQSRMLSASAKGKTALLDAIYLGLTQTRGARNGKRALLIISDGGDNNSRYNEKDIKRLVREADTQLYSIGIFDPIEYRSRTPEDSCKGKGGCKASHNGCKGKDSCKGQGRLRDRWLQATSGVV
jgi:Ca-activated chloride channel homolog